MKKIITEYLFVQSANVNACVAEIATHPNCSVQFVVHTLEGVSARGIKTEGIDDLC